MFFFNYFYNLYKLWTRKNLAFFGHAGKVAIFLECSPIVRNGNLFTNMDLEYHLGHMRSALRLANYALHNGEVPVACVFVHDGEIISYGMNNTNDSLSGINHAEFRGINKILEREDRSIFKEIDLYVTVEPCVMCASALKQIGIRNVYFGCGNERFGGNGSVFQINKDKTTPENDYASYPGLLRKEAITLLRKFYVKENTRAPIPRDKTNRNLNTESFPELVWENYLTKDEFINLFGIDKIRSFNNNLDIFELDEDNLENFNIDDIKNSSNSFYNKKRKI